MVEAVAGVAPRLAGQSLAERRAGHGGHERQGGRRPFALRSAVGSARLPVATVGCWRAASCVMALTVNPGRFVLTPQTRLCSIDAKGEPGG